VPAIITFLHFALVVYCVLDIARTPRDRFVALPKPLWFFVVLFLPILGSVMWLIVGRPEVSGSPSGGSGGSGSGRGASPRGGTGPAGGSRAPRPDPPRGPEDDPEFLRAIEERLRRDRREGRDRRDEPGS
jgi:hypothetical protein